MCIYTSFVQCWIRACLSNPNMPFESKHICEHGNILVGGAGDAATAPHYVPIRKHVFAFANMWVFD